MYELDRMKEYLPKIEQAIKDKDTQIAKLKNSDFGKFQEYVCNSGVWANYKGIEEEKRYYGIGYRPYSNPDLALSALNQTYEKVQAVDDINQEITRQNTELRDKLIMLCESVGLKKTSRQLKKRSRYKYEDVDNPWYSALKYIGPKYPYGHISDSAKYYEQQKKKIDDWRKSIENEKLEQEKQELERKAIRKKNIVLSSLITKYNLDEDIEECEILNTILDKCKYLKLAHYMLMNRNDWTDGPDYASIGYSSFTVENDIDKQIDNEIGTLISDWDGDGRCFRDCQWNYDVLFGKVDSELFKDYEKAKTLVGV